MTIRSALSIALLAASACVAAQDAAPPPAAASAAEVDAAPVEIVRGGGVADTWRSEGAAHATFGPEGDAVVPTIERQALQALANADDVRFVALADGAGCAGGPDCLGGLVVAARSPAADVAGYRFAREIAQRWLGEPAAAEAGEATAYRHALAFTAGGRAWAVLLAFDGGRYRLLRDGVTVGEGVAGDAWGRSGFEARLPD